MNKKIQFQNFIILPWDIDYPKGILSLNYSYDDKIFFTETINFNRQITKENIKQLKKSFDLLSIIAGISYYKAYIPDNIIIKDITISKQELLFIKNTYKHGLGEFACRNKINLNNKLNFIYKEEKQSTSHEINLPDISAILIGGGKDSITSLNILTNSNTDLLTFTVNKKAPMSDTIKISGLKNINIDRKLDPKLFTLNEQGALNGHIPITAIISIIAISAALIYGFKNIILSNERSANEGNTIHNDVEVNHQYSKSLDFELEFSKIIKDSITPSISYFSLLRPLSELHITSLFSKNSSYDKIFTSCNKTFKINNACNSNGKWCNNCPKCLFVFLMLANFMSKERLLSIFGTNLLDDNNHMETYKELCGLSGHKPWECVGEIKESCASIYNLSLNKNWNNDLIIASLKNSLINNNQDIGEYWHQLLTPSQQHNIPTKFLNIMESYIETN